MSDETLAELRTTIDILDTAIFSILAERYRVTRKVGLLKKAAGLEPVDLNREQQQIAKIRELARSLGLDCDYAERIARFIMTETVKTYPDKKP